MDKCSTEIISLIFEYACADDFGETARQLGLVSKFFRAVAEPIELRTIAVSGLRQLQGVAARLGIVQSTDPQPQPQLSASSCVKHLFICELTKEHALDAHVNPYCTGGLERWWSFWRSDEGTATIRSCRDNTGAFWNLTSALVKFASCSLKSLFLSSAQGFSVPVELEMFQGVFGSLCCQEFSNLEYLVVYDGVGPKIRIHE